MAKKEKKKTNDQISQFDAGMLSYIGMNLLVALLTIISLTLATPWIYCMYTRWYTRHTLIEGRRLKFDGGGWQLLGNYIKWFFLTLITLGIFGLWVGVKFEKWKIKHTKFDAPEMQAQVNVYNVQGEAAFFPAQSAPVYNQAPVAPMAPQQPVCQQPAFHAPAFPLPPYGFPMPMYPTYPQMPYGCPHQNNGNNGNNQNKA